MITSKKIDNVFTSSLIIFISIICLLLVPEKISLAAKKNIGECVVLYRSTYDGDTFYGDVECYNNGVNTFYSQFFSIRLSGIDAPEIKPRGRSFYNCEEDLSVQAKSFLENKLQNANEITVKNTSFEKYGRLLGDVYIDGQPISPEMISKGLAVDYYGKKKTVNDWCKVKTRLK